MFFSYNYGVDDCFDGLGLVAEKVTSRFVAAEEVVAYQLAKKAVSNLIASNATFGAMLFADLSNKLSAIAQRKSQHELQSLTMARVDEAFVRPAHFVDGDTDIVRQAVPGRAHHFCPGARLRVRITATGNLYPNRAAEGHPERNTVGQTSGS